MTDWETCVDACNPNALPKGKDHLAESVEPLPNTIHSPHPQLQPNLIPGWVNMRIKSNDIYESALTITK